MSENKYEIRVRQRAEEMARTHFSSQVKKYNVTSIKKRKEWDQLHASHRDMLTREFIDVARLSVQREAEVASWAFRDGVLWDNAKLYDTPGEKVKCNSFLQSLGLVPENDKPCGT